MNKRFTVMNHEFTNTGGNCMVSSFTVYDKQLNATRCVLVNEEGFVLATVDYICNEIQFENVEEERAVIIDNWTLDCLTTEPSYDQPQFTEEEFALYKYCQFEFYKEYCKYFNTKVKLMVHELPGEMYNELGMDAILWHDRNEEYVTTDGYQAYFNDAYDAAGWENACKELQQIKDFQLWHCEQAAKEELYEERYVLSFAGRSVKLPYDADTFDAVDSLLTRIIEEW